MSINGITSPPSPLAAGGGASPTDALTELLLALRQARQVHHETEQAFSNAAIQSAEAQARHASDKAEATRLSALLQFSINAGQALGSISSDIATSRAENPERTGQINSSVQAEIGCLADVARSTDDAFGFGNDASELEAQMEQDSTQQSTFQAYEDRARTVGNELDDAIADVRQTLRDVNNGENGG